MIQGTFNTPGPIISGLILLVFSLVTGMRIIYFFVMILFLIAAIWRLRLKETVKSEEPIRFRYFISSYPQAFKECCVNVWKVVPRSVLWLFSVQIMFMFANALFNVINSLYAIDQLGIPEDLWWIVYIPLLIAMIVMSVPIGKMIDRIGPKIPLLMAPVALAASSFLFAFGNFALVMISMVLNGLVFLLLMASGMTLATNLVEPENRGKVRGFLNFMGYIVTGIGMLVGDLFYTLHPPLPFYIAAGLSLPMFIIIALRVHEKEEVKHMHEKIDDSV
jgi:MFS family permease